MKAIGYQNLSVGNTPVGLTVPEGAIYAEMVIESAPNATAEIVARFSESGTAPTATEGMPLSGYSILQVKGGNMQTFRVIATEAAISHSIKVQYFG